MSLKTTLMIISVYAYMAISITIGMMMDAIYHHGTWETVSLAVGGIVLITAVVGIILKKYSSRFPHSDTPPLPNKEDANFVAFFLYLFNLGMFLLLSIRRWNDLDDPSVAIGWKSVFIVFLALYAKAALRQFQYSLNRWQQSQGG